MLLDDRSRTPIAFLKINLIEVDGNENKNSIKHKLKKIYIINVSLIRFNSKADNSQFWPLVYLPSVMRTCEWCFSLKLF